MTDTTKISNPWNPDYLAQQIHILTETVEINQQLHHCDTNHNAHVLLDGARFHLDFLDHHLQHALFPSEDPKDNPSAPFRHDPSLRYLSVMAASANPNEPPLKRGAGAALHISSSLQSGGKPVMNQSALHGFHVFEGLQLVAEPLESGAYRFSYTFLRDKVAKLIDGIIRLRFAVHLLKASILIRHLENTPHPEVHTLKARFSHILNHHLSYRRSQAEEAATKALLLFADVNREEMTAALEGNPSTCFYVRIEAQGGNRQSIGQGPIGVGQSTLQIFGQHVQKPHTPTQVVINPNSPPRMHTLAGPFRASPFHALLNNCAVHHGNMGHQHLASEMAQPYASHMLMSTAEIDEHGRLRGPFIAETNFSNIGFEYDGRLIFPRSNSATYGLTQHVIRTILADSLDQGRNLPMITGFEHVHLPLERFMADLRDGKVTSAFVLGSMPGIEPVSIIYVDETLSGGSITSYSMNHESPCLKTLINLYQEACHQ